jgi:hypothetical protein
MHALTHTSVAQLQYTYFIWYQVDVSFRVPVFDVADNRAQQRVLRNFLRMRACVRAACGERRAACGVRRAACVRACVRVSVNISVKFRFCLFCLHIAVVYNSSGLAVRSRSLTQIAHWPILKTRYVFIEISGIARHPAVGRKRLANVRAVSEGQIGEARYIRKTINTAVCKRCGNACGRTRTKHAERKTWKYWVGVDTGRDGWTLTCVAVALTQEPSWRLQRNFVFSTHLCYIQLGLRNLLFAGLRNAFKKWQ